jgi:hypothetical protein
VGGIGGQPGRRDGPQHGQADRTGGVEPRGEQVVQHLPELHVADATRGQQRRQVPGALQVALRPAGALPQQPLDVDEALLGHRRVRQVAHLRPGQVHAKTQFQVLHQALRPRLRTEVDQRGQPGELAVAAEADGAQRVAHRLAGVGDAAELQVLHGGQHPVPVVDAHPALGGAHPRVAHGVGDLQEHVGAAPAVAVDDADRDAVRVADLGGRAVADVSERGVERLALALPGLRRVPTQDVQARVVDPGQHVRRRIVGPVIDDQHPRAGAPRSLERQGARHGVGDDPLLVETGHDDPERGRLRGDRCCDVDPPRCRLAIAPLRAE